MAPTRAGNTLFIILSMLSGSLTSLSRGCAEAADGGRPGMFVFGSSLVDNGNNNFLRDPGVRADYAPYGVDYPMGPSGRFSNGRNQVDALGELLKLPGRIPPFLDPATTGDRILRGVNYASGGSGILDDTRPTTGTAVSLNKQISNFEGVTLPQLRAQLGRKGRSLAAELPKYLFVVGTGGNDYLLNYFLGGQTVSLQDFTALLASTLVSQLKRLYELGARKFVLFSLQPIGCVPVVRAMLQAANGTCLESINEAALLFNQKLCSVVDNSKRQYHMPGSHLVYVNSYKIITDILRSPARRGFTEKKVACCATSPTFGVLCERGGRVCCDRDAYVFFDGLHPTEAVNLKIAEKAYGSRRKAEAYPVNVKQLAEL